MKFSFEHLYNDIPQIDAAFCSEGSLLDQAIALEIFLYHLFDISQSQTRGTNIDQIRRQFVQRYALKKYRGCAKPDLPDFLTNASHFEEKFIQTLLTLSPEDPLYEDLACYAAWAVDNKNSFLFKAPHSRDPDHLIPHLGKDSLGRWFTPQQRSREGFDLTDPGLSKEEALYEAHYCIKCHPQGKDSCSKGYPKPDAFGHALTGCPLNQKISEMHTLYQQGYTLAALAVIMIDNPLVALTGHRICNECRRACIFQKQESVNTPGVETRILREILDLPFGVEIYGLLMRWNPLCSPRRLPQTDSGKAILVTGLGPAGLTLSYYLLQAGHTVLGIDGLKIEPLPSDFLCTPIRSFEEISKDLSERCVGGVGGVAEYGITVRWDKNFLTLIRILLERYSRFRIRGGVRLGGTITIDQAFDLGFHHVALCMGAGRPTLLSLPNGSSAGIRQASEFLMALQLTGAAKASSLANLQMEWPVVVIGGGLTAIDTATEALAYYSVQLEKFLSQETFSVDEAVANEWSRHGIALREASSWQEKRRLLQEWGGVTLLYRKSLIESPSYTRNAEEVAYALEEGIRILDNATPVRFESDETGHVCGVWILSDDVERFIPARSVFIAAGTLPNTHVRYDIPGEVRWSGENLALFDDFFNRIDTDGRSVSVLGDQNPKFSGNVVRAMASAKKAFPVLHEQIQKISGFLESDFLSSIERLLMAHVHDVIRLTPTIVEVIVHAPLAAKAFQPGQFYRLQNYESCAETFEGKILTMEGLALTGAGSLPDEGLISLIVLEMGTSSRLCRSLKPGEPVVLMGPTGMPTEIPEKETVLLMGGGLGNAVLFSIGQAMRAKGCRVVYAAGYKKIQDRYKVDAIKAASDHILWCCDEDPGFVADRPGDASFKGNMLEALLAYAQGDFPQIPIRLSEMDRLLVIGSDGLMHAIAKARQTVLKPYLKPGHKGIGSINAPMQCMMKEICAQCLQRHVDPQTGEEWIVYTCAEQDQNLDTVDFKSLRQRLSQNHLQENLTRSWLDNYSQM